MQHLNVTSNFLSISILWSWSASVQQAVLTSTQVPSLSDEHIIKCHSVLQGYLRCSNCKAEIALPIPSIRAHILTIAFYNSDYNADWWKPVFQITSTLQRAFYLLFGTLSLSFQETSGCTEMSGKKQKHSNVQVPVPWTGSILWASEPHTPHNLSFLKALPYNNSYRLVYDQ